MSFCCILYKTILLILIVSYLKNLGKHFLYSIETQMAQSQQTVSIYFYFSFILKTGVNNFS